MAPQAPTIVSVIRLRAQAHYQDDPHPLLLEHVDARMSDGSVARLYIAKPGEITLTDDELLGLTVEQARDLADRRGEAL